MASENYEETIRLKKRFVVIYICSLVLLSLFFGAWWLYHSSSGENQQITGSQESTETTALLNMDETLHEGLMYLDALNISYSKLLAESADSATLDSVNNLINASQIAFGNLVDKMYSQRNIYKNPSNANKADSIIYAFISSLNSQKADNALRMAFSGDDVNLERDSFALFQSQIDMQTKSDSIMNLRDQLKYQNQFNRNTFPAAQSFQNNAEVASLQANIKAQKDSLENIMTLYNSATKDNQNLTAQLTKLKSSPAKADVSESPDKTKSLNAKIDDLNAELSLAKIDCSLTRANGKDIIYNSRQRRDLLEASLASLKNLSKSDNPVIQRKVKDRLQLLQNIAATVRD